VVDSAGHVGEQVGVAVADPRDEQADLGLGRDLCPGRECGPAFEVGDVGLHGFEFDTVRATPDRGPAEMVVTENHIGTKLLARKTAPRQVA
jgi:hypothetical protein